MSGEIVVFLVALPFMVVAWLKGHRVLGLTAAGLLVVLVLGLLGLAGIFLLVLAVPLAFGPAFSPARGGSLWWEKVYDDTRRDRVTNRVPLPPSQRWLVAIGAFVTLLTGFGLVLGLLGAGLGHQEDLAIRFAIAFLVWAGAASIALGLYRSRPWSFLAVPVIPLLFVVAAGALAGGSPRETVSEDASGPAAFLAVAYRGEVELPDLLALDARGRTLAVSPSPFWSYEVVSVCPGGKRVLALGEFGSTLVVYDSATLAGVATHKLFSDSVTWSVGPVMCRDEEAEDIVAVVGHTEYHDGNDSDGPEPPPTLSGSVIAVGSTPRVIAEGEWSDQSEAGALTSTQAVIAQGAPETRVAPVLLVDLETGQVEEVPEWRGHTGFIADPTGRWAFAHTASEKGRLVIVDLASPETEPRVVSGSYEAREARWFNGLLFAPAIVDCDEEEQDVTGDCPQPYEVHQIDPATMSVQVQPDWSALPEGFSEGMGYYTDSEAGRSVLYAAGLDSGQVTRLRTFDTDNVSILIVLPEPIGVHWPVVAAG